MPMGVQRKEDFQGVSTLIILGIHQCKPNANKKPPLTLPVKANGGKY
jgi:hypothetical protein